MRSRLSFCVYYFISTYITIIFTIRLFASDVMIQGQSERGHRSFNTSFLRFLNQIVESLAQKIEVFLYHSKITIRRRTISLKAACKINTLS